jgi:hypothetical protein
MQSKTLHRSKGQRTYAVVVRRRNAHKSRFPDAAQHAVVRPGNQLSPLNSSYFTGAASGMKRWPNTGSL